jgi:hypothetical protein
MDRVTTLTDTVRRVVSTYATQGYNGNGEPSKLYYLENVQEQVFSILGPYDPAFKQAHLILMVRIVNDQIIIDQDKTSVSLRDELKRAGIPENQISLAWHRK